MEIVLLARPPLPAALNLDATYELPIMSRFAFVGAVLLVAIIGAVLLVVH